jgi:hypothetical protein
MKKGPQAKSVYAKAAEGERQLTDADVFGELPKKICPCGEKFTPVITRQRYCSDLCWSFYTGVQLPKVTQ